MTERFYIHDEIRDSDACDALVIDDLCASGASLSAATRVLRSHSKVRKVFVAVFQGPGDEKKDARPQMQTDGYA